METPMDQLKRVMKILRKKYPDWSDGRVYHCALYAVLNPDWKNKKEKTKQSDNEIYTPNQISFEDLLLRGETYA